MFNCPVRKKILQELKYNFVGLYILTKQTFGLRFIALSYRTHKYEHLGENIMPIALLFTEI